eukprot:8198262-Alexandrium_andersonii.AAC.1
MVTVSPTYAVGFAIAGAAPLRRVGAPAIDCFGGFRQTARGGSKHTTPCVPMFGLVRSAAHEELRVHA